MQAVILAGGRGTRLGPMTDAIPKPMMPVAGRPYLEHQLRLLRDASVTDVVLLTGYLGDQIETYFGSGKRLGLDLRYSRETAPMGTGGALRLAASLLADTFLLIYGDSFLPVDYADILQTLERNNSLGAMVVFDNQTGNSPVRSNVDLHRDGRIARYEKDSPNELRFVEAGVLAFRRLIVDRIPEGVVSIENDVFPQVIAEGKMLGYVTPQPFYDIGTPERLALLNQVLGIPANRPAVSSQMTGVQEW